MNKIKEIKESTFYSKHAESVVIIKEDFEFLLMEAELFELVKESKNKLEEKEINEKEFIKKLKEIMNEA